MTTWASKSLFISHFSGTDDAVSRKNVPRIWQIPEKQCEVNKADTGLSQVKMGHWVGSNPPTSFSSSSSTSNPDQSN
ncbi:hypothetical protein N7452_001565 [Penicillium brevicompactum]|uniref:Uncharacterized protein n=1 Tax=Penicillium brevicompactum TaxID=5074 RepID=A0A9W9R2Q7_PENBR|nr:hypothetical protein N7452_001565 [Penicillium brevicompactum]